MNINTPFELLTIGRRIEYTGDMANEPGFGAIVAIEPADQFGGPYATISLSDGREFLRENVRRLVHISQRRGCAFRLMFSDDYADTMEVAELIAAVATRKANDKAKKDASAHKFSAEVERLKAEHPELEVGKYAKVAAANCRKLLKAAFPGVKFSVRSGRATWSSKLDIEWTDGPTTKQVEEITDKFSDGHFDGMQDLYEHTATPWNETFGSAEYVSARRNYSDAMIDRAIAAVVAKYGDHNTPTVDDYKHGRACNTSPISGAVSTYHCWYGLINRAAEEIAA